MRKPRSWLSLTLAMRLRGGSTFMASASHRAAAALSAARSAMRNRQPVVQGVGKGGR